MAYFTGCVTLFLEDRCRNLSAGLVDTFLAIPASSVEPEKGFSILVKH